MTLPPFANLCALGHRDAAAVDRREEIFRRSGVFESVVRPSPQWVLGIAPLPGGDVPCDLPDGGLYFAEGGDLVRGAGADASARCGAFARALDGEPAQVAGFPGDFGAFRFRPDGSLTAVRSCGGCVPIYHAARGAGVFVATRSDYFVRFGAATGEFDPLVVALWVTGPMTFPGGRTHLEGVRVVPRGHILEIAPGKVPRERRYWEPRPERLPRFRARHAAEAAARFRDVVLKHLERNLDTASGNLLSLSGGVDSSTVGALAAGVLGRPMSSVTFLPPGEDDRRRDLDYIERLTKGFHFQRSRRIVITWEYLLDLSWTGPPHAFPFFHPVLRLLPQVQRETDVRVLVGGEFADEICGAPAAIADWVVHTRPDELVRMGRRLPTGPGDVRRWVRHRLRPRRARVQRRTTIASLVRQPLRSEASDWARRRWLAVALDPAANPYLAASVEADGFVVMNWEATSALGIRRSLPFFHREVLELALGTHPAARVGPGTKTMLREAFAGLVPEHFLLRADKATWATDAATARLAWKRELPEALRTLLPENWWPRPRWPLSVVEAVRLQVLSGMADGIAQLVSRAEPL